jgi:signal transduction histidine kinase
MDDIARLLDAHDDCPFAVRQKIKALIQENRSLKGTVVSLQQRLRVETEEDVQQKNQLHYLREANQHLVLATFGAQDLKEAAEAANKRQITFLAMLAHELRNPMASVIVAATVIDSLNIDHPRARKLLAIVQRQVTHLLRLVDDLMDVSRIKTGKFSLQTRLIPLLEVIESAIETTQPSLAKNSQELVVNLPSPPVYLQGDPVRLSQLFANLLLNASKFSAHTETISLSASVQDGMLAVTVKDNGRGIPIEFQSGIFALFAQGPDSLEHSQADGLGIGLTLVRAIAEMHGGSVRVESKGNGWGSAFIVMLPLPAAPPVPPEKSY